nr:hypothetical protein GCM10020092_063520 [Actinoplanes digitatis]
MNADDLEGAIRLMRDVLAPPTSTGDWSAQAGSLDWTCRETLVHIAHDLLAYATQLAGREQEKYLPLDLTVRDDATPSDVLAVVEACGGLLLLALRAAGPDKRGWHFGPCDAGGFAALGTAEVLIHTYDITQGLQVTWWPPAELSAAVLARLMPDASTERRHPTGVLLRHTGRFGDVGPWRWNAALRPNGGRSE